MGTERIIVVPNVARDVAFVLLQDKGKMKGDERR